MKYALYFSSSSLQFLSPLSLSVTFSSLSLLLCFPVHSCSSTVTLECRAIDVEADRSRHGYKLTPTHRARTHILISRLLNVLSWNGKFMLSPTAHKPCFIANLYISLSLFISLCLCSVSLSPLRPRYHLQLVIQLMYLFCFYTHTSSKSWQSFGSTVTARTHTRTPETEHIRHIFAFEAKHHESLSNCHSAIDSVAWCH